MKPTRRQLNVLTKTQIKMRRAKTFKECIDEMARGVSSFVITGFLDNLIIEGDGWIAMRNFEASEEMLR